ncbi:hypothetical protein [Rhodoferax sp.]|uniref:hypothetical protein n=1 Tax=Rhodoferax sp. TaxID=50421 RepID=UPI0027524E56|nr:hypothetical protein [Rhodoferax sp.]
MTLSALNLSETLRCATLVLFFIGLAPPVHAAGALPDPCKLIALAELEPIVGPLKGSPKSGDIKAGDVSCEYTPAKGASWIEIRLHDGDLASWKRRNGGKSPVSLPDLGADAFANPDSDGSAELFVKKGALILRLSMPKSPAAVEQLKKIAQKALPRL